MSPHANDDTGQGEKPAKKANALNNAFPSGTLMLFQQTAAPVYWTKQTTHNDKALRVVSGTAGSGGTNAFSVVNGATAAFVNGHVLTVAEMPSHSPPVTPSGVKGAPNGGVSFGLVSQPGAEYPFVAIGTSNTGGDVAHSHTLNMAIAYVDLIICSKD
jgi:hypothetical protein